MLTALPLFDNHISLPWWGVLLVVFALTHITALCISVYLHRYSAHRAMELHPAVQHFFRFWLWLTTGMETKAWTAIHRKHHARCETADDPHSPQVLTLKKVLLQGAELYRKEAHNTATMARYGQGTPDDWMERNVYGKHSGLGIRIMLILNVFLFGPIGITIWAMQMIWTPLCAAGIINGIGHYIGYRNFECSDASTNIVPWGFLIMGEELHNNHHTFASSAKFSVKPWEFDMGWCYIRLLTALKLARPKRVAPELYENPSKQHIDVDTVKALVRNRFNVMAQYNHDVIRPMFKEMRTKAEGNKEKLRALSDRVCHIMIRDDNLVKTEQKTLLQRALDTHEPLQVIYQFQQQLQAIWEKTTASQKELIEALQEWCRQAESTRIQVLHDFAARVRTYTLTPSYSL